VAFDDFGREFVFRQPANEDELAAIMSADSEEVFACYRFDGLDHWTVSSLNAWSEDAHVIDGWIEHVLARETEDEILEGVRAYRDHLASSEFHTYMGGLYDLLSAKKGPATSVPRRQS